MSKILAWLNAARLRTLPLSVSGVITGTALANFYGQKNTTLIFIIALLTTISFQVTSNFANDYGDGVKGTDNENRIGPKRALQSGLLTRNELKKGIIIAIVISIILVPALLYASFGKEYIEYFTLFAILGISSIWASIKYTIGTSAYGYKGLGDIFVFVFFGLLSVIGTMFLYTKFIAWPSLLPAFSIGLLSTGVLNLNNLRDYESDKNSKKNTLVVKMGFDNGKKYHFALLILAFFSLLIFMIFNFSNWYHLVPLTAFIPVFLHMHKVYRTDHAVKLDSELKKLALSTFLLSLLFYICYN